MKIEFIFLGKADYFKAELRTAGDKANVNVPYRIVEGQKDGAARVVIHLHRNLGGAAALQHKFEALETGKPLPPQRETVGEGVITVVEQADSQGIVTCRVMVEIKGHRMLEKRWNRLYRWLDEHNRIAPALPEWSKVPQDDGAELSGTHHEKIDGLTPRQLEIAQLLAQGLTKPEIARRLVMASSGVKTHCRNISKKWRLDTTKTETMQKAAKERF